MSHINSNKVEINPFIVKPFSLTPEEKKAFLFTQLYNLTRLHYERCCEYHRILEAFSVQPDLLTTCERIPFFPVSLFKELELLSIDRKNVFKIMTSSGTTGQAVSKIFLDRATAAAQQKALVNIVKEFTGACRIPMLIIDAPSVLKDRAMFSARGAGILGFSLFGTDKAYALDNDMNLDQDGVSAFLERHQGQKLLLFGFTFIVWQYFYQALLKLTSRYDFSQGILIHGGGWKKLQHKAVTPQIFRKRLAESCGLTKVHNYYGMVEQTGSIYMECEYGHLHVSIFSDIIIRRAYDLNPAAIGEPGIVQTLSILPDSYPGHSLLTEDEGVLLGEDDCPCGRKGKYFQVIGRLKNAEIRGCSDTYEAQF